MTQPFYQRKDRERRDVEGPAIKWAFKHGWTHIKITSPTSNSWPDDLFMRNGEYVWWEFKAPGKKPTPLQANRHEEMAGIKCRVHWTDDVNLTEFKRIMA